MADYLYTTQAPNNSSIDFITHHLGARFSLSQARQATGGRAWVPQGGRPNVFFWQLWNFTTATKLAEVDLNNPALPTPAEQAWMTFTADVFIANPPDLLLGAASTYVCNVFCGGPAGSRFVWLAPFIYPVAGGGVATILDGRYETGQPKDTPPSRQDLGEAFFADVLLAEPGSAAAPGTLVPGGAQATLAPSGTAAALSSSGTASVLNPTGTP